MTTFISNNMQEDLVESMVWLRML